MKILFVCLGNICRSPSAESVFREHWRRRGLNADFDSAGTAGYHEGERSDPRSIRFAEARGYPMKHLARKVRSSDFEDFDLIFAMDGSNLRNLQAICPPQHQRKLHLLSEFASSIEATEVPDPYYGGDRDFEFVLDLLEDCVEQVAKRFGK